MLTGLGERCSLTAGFHIFIFLFFLHVDYSHAADRWAMAGAGFHWSGASIDFTRMRFIIRAMERMLSHGSCFE